MKKSDEKTLSQITKNGTIRSLVVGSKDCPFDRAILVTDEKLANDPKGKIIATILQSEAGNIIYWHREGYDPLAIQVDSEVTAFQTYRAGRHMEFKVEHK